MVTPAKRLQPPSGAGPDVRPRNAEVMLISSSPVACLSLRVERNVARLFGLFF